MFRKASIAILYLIAAILFPVAANAAKTSAAQVVSAVSDAITKAPAIEAKFTMRQQGHQPVNGTAFIQGRKFTVTLPEIRTWFDGKTQWTYSKDAGEVNITEPTADELAETNPVSAIVNNAKNCKARRLDAPKGTDRVELIPTGSNRPFRKAIATSDATTNFLREIIVTMNDGSSVTITFTSMKKAAKKADKHFRFAKTLIPSAKVVDLR